MQEEKVSGMFALFSLPWDKCWDTWSSSKQMSTFCLVWGGGVVGWGDFMHVLKKHNALNW